MDNEVSGIGNTNTATFWEYDTRLGRRWNVDPVVKSWASPYATFSCSPTSFVDPNGDADYYSASGRWLGTDGKNDNEIFVVTSRLLKKEIIASSRQGLFYTKEVQNDRKVLRIPRRDIRLSALAQYNETKWNGYETGGHSYDFNSSATLWDKGTEYEENGDLLVAGVEMFKVGGVTTFADESEVDFYWHSHPKKAQDENHSVTYGPSTGYSDKNGMWQPGDIEVAGALKMRGYNADAFVFDNDRVYYYDEKGIRGTMITKPFQKMGDEKRGGVYKSFKKRGGLTKDIYDIVPDNNKDKA